jgi:hypothetical protein
MDGGWREGEARGGGSEQADAANRFPGSELQVESRAGVVREDAMAGDGVDGGGMMSEWQQGGVGHGGSLDEITAAGCFPGPELRVESQAGVSRPVVGAQRLCSPAGAGKKENGSATARAELMAGRAGDGGAGTAETAQDKCARLRAEVKALFRTDRRWEEKVKWGREEATKRRWEAIWRAREAKEQVARARRLAAQDQGSRARPAQTGPCAACARQGGICGFCRERQRLAC